jgi:hypothetical protein
VVIICYKYINLVGVISFRRGDDDDDGGGGDGGSDDSG